MFTRSRRTCKELQTLAKTWSDPNKKVSGINRGINSTQHADGPLFHFALTDSYSTSWLLVFHPFSNIKWVPFEKQVKNLSKAATENKVFKDFYCDSYYDSLIIIIFSSRQPFVCYFNVNVIKCELKEFKKWYLFLFVCWQVTSREFEKSVECVYWRLSSWLSVCSSFHWMCIWVCIECIECIALHWMHSLLKWLPSKSKHNFGKSIVPFFRFTQLQKTTSKCAIILCNSSVFLLIQQNREKIFLKRK